MTVYTTTSYPPFISQTRSLFPLSSPIILLLEEPPILSPPPLPLLAHEYYLTRIDPAVYKTYIRKYNAGKLLPKGQTK